MTPEERDAFRRMPIMLRRDGTLPPGAPRAEVLNALHSRGLIDRHNGDQHRWTLSPAGVVLWRQMFSGQEPGVDATHEK